MDLEKRIEAFMGLGAHFREDRKGLEKAIDIASKKNGWFTEENIRLAIASLGKMLEGEKIRKWVDKYTNQKHQVPIPIAIGTKPQGKKPETNKIGVIMAGNIPLVGFHDFLCVLMSGNVFVGKLSSDDEILLPAVAEILCTIEEEFRSRILFTEEVQGSRFKVQRFMGKQGTQNAESGTAADAFIATGSNNSARYFEYYFGKRPNIIRKNRNSVAVLDGSETEEDLKNLGKDIFQYFGMGCRNVSKIYIPEDYNLDKFFSAIVDFGDVINHNKYYNNHQYYRTIYLLNNEKFLDNNFLMLKESEPIASPVATLYYERYKNQAELLKKLEKQKENIQCIVTSQKSKIKNQKIVHFGKTQNPELWDYADGVDTMEFLMHLNFNSHH